jgi:hypothetical protein
MLNWMVNLVSIAMHQKTLRLLKYQNLTRYQMLIPALLETMIQMPLARLLVAEMVSEMAAGIMAAEVEMRVRAGVFMPRMGLLFPRRIWRKATGARSQTLNRKIKTPSLRTVEIEWRYDYNLGR